MAGWANHRLEMMALNFDYVSCLVCHKRIRGRVYTFPIADGDVVHYCETCWGDRSMEKGKGGCDGS